MRFDFPALTAVLLLALGLAGAIVASRFLSWRRSKEVLLELNGTVVETAEGPVEYAEIGRGAPVLILHGTPGGYDQVLNYLKATGAGENGVRYIVPSRPGYLRTPLSSGRSPDEQAKLFAILLTWLGIERAAVIGISGGGPCALAFAAKYPTRCSALILLEAATQSIEVVPHKLPALVMDFLLYASQKHAVAGARRLADPVVAEIAAGMFDSVCPMRHRIRGYENDRAEFRRLELALDVIECPTLILHGSLDTEAPVAHAHFAHAKIANSQLVVFDGADHSMLASEYKDVVRRMTEFVLLNSRAGCYSGSTAREGELGRPS